MIPVQKVSYTTYLMSRKGQIYLGSQFWKIIILADTVQIGKIIIISGDTELAEICTRRHSINKMQGHCVLP
jgi:hypothetical protein